MKRRLLSASIAPSSPVAPHPYNATLPFQHAASTSPWGSQAAPSGEPRTSTM